MKRLQKISLALLAGLALSAGGIVFASCAGHQHSYVKDDILPTCTQGGYTLYACVCGDTYTDDEVPATGHAYGNWIETSAPTCTEAGEREKTCSNCSDVQREDVPATGHHHDPVVTAPTCTEEGYTTYTCSCGDTYTDDEVPATGHHHDPVVTAPTCTEEGYTTYTCSCGDTYTDDEVPATGHHHDYVTTPPTETEQGYTTYTCDCGDTYVADFLPPLGVSFKVAFDENGGSDVSDQNVKEGGKALEPKTPTKTGYLFDGWFVGAEKWSFDEDTVTQAMTLTAGWTLEQYRLSYETNGGLAENPVEYTIETETITLEEPTKTGYTFLGWTGTDLSEMTKAVTIEKGSVGERAYTAHWEAKINTLRFYGNGETGGEMVEMKIATDGRVTLTLNAFVKEGFRFEGWSTTAGGAVAYEDGGEYTMGSNSIYSLYAVWSDTNEGPIVPARF